MTSKEWVIPPRPKPGRKPATDTPPTKRKAQNRAAQRAFRERRAARVGELEEQLDQQRDVFASEAAELQSKIRHLELELQSFRSRCVLLESMLEYEHQSRIRTGASSEPMASRNSGSSSGKHSSPSVVPRNSVQPRPGEHQPPDQMASPRPQSFLSPQNTPEIPGTETILPPGCADCDFGPKCQCLNDVGNAFNTIQEPKRSISPSDVSGGGKRHRPVEPRTADTVEPTFARLMATSCSTAQPQAPPSTDPDGDSPLDPSILKGSCGFCKEGTYCICAEDAQASMQTSHEDAILPPVAGQIPLPLPPMTMTASPPTPMEMTAEGAVKLPSRKAAQPSRKATQDGQPSGPGTCAQCRADPKSGLFCRLMAANCNTVNGQASERRVDDGHGPTSSAGKHNLPSLTSLGLSCADAYQTLSSHRYFSRAADDMDWWLPKLRTTTSRRAVSQAGRMPMEVEAASIMSVLRDFDVRFGEERPSY